MGREPPIAPRQKWVRLRGNLLHPHIREPLTPLQPCRIDLESERQAVNDTGIDRLAVLDLLDYRLIGSCQSGKFLLGDAFGLSGLPESGADGELCLFQFLGCHGGFLELCVEAILYRIALEI